MDFLCDRIWDSTKIGAVCILLVYKRIFHKRNCILKCGNNFILFPAGQIDPFPFSQRGQSVFIHRLLRGGGLFCPFRCCPSVLPRAGQIGPLPGQRLFPGGEHCGERVVRHIPVSRRAHRALRALRLGRPGAGLVLHRLPRTLHDSIQLLDVRIVILEHSGELCPRVLRICFVVAPDQGIEFVINGVQLFHGQIKQCLSWISAFNYNVQNPSRISCICYTFTYRIHKAAVSFIAALF